MRASFARFALITGGLLMALATTASAQTRTTGAIRGVITDQASGEPVAGATVVVTGPTLQGSQAEITDGTGQYMIANLPPGTYLITVYYSEVEFSRPNALVQLGRVAQINIPIDTRAGKGEVITIEGRAPVIDQGSTKTGRTITPDYTQNIPTGRTFGDVLGSVAGSQGDLYGVSFGGSTSAENVYIVEGLNTTDPAYGVQSTNLPNEFIQETEVISGGYNAEYGRSTGGVINVVTKSGSNELHGSVFTTVTPGALRAAEVPTPRSGSAISRVDELVYDAAMGAELGGPIVKDKVWFHVGFNPSFNNHNVHRVISSLVDEDQDGNPDVDLSGFTVFREVGRRTLSRGGRTLFFTSKITAALSPDHQGSLSILGNPGTQTSYATVVGVEHAGLRDIESGAYDGSFRWTSQFNNNKTQLDAMVGVHRNHYREIPVAAGQSTGIRYDYYRPLSAYEAYEMDAIPGQCRAGDPSNLYPLLDDTCPVIFYNVGGHMFREARDTERVSALLSFIQRLRFLGHHTMKAGIDTEFQTFDQLSDFPGGERFRIRAGNMLNDRWYTLDSNGTEFCDVGLDEPLPCIWQQNGLATVTTTRNLGAYVQDTWAMRPNLTLNAGLRWERQTLYVADKLRGLPSVVTGDPIPDVAFEISHMLAPRVGLIFDPTEEGRSKLFAHWGRFYESIPMGINARAFGGEVYNRNTFGDSTYPPPCDVTEPGCADRVYFGGGEERVAPGLKGQFMDELVIGGEYELRNDFKIGVSYVRRNLGRVIEDISTDGGLTYLIANPGEADLEAIQRLRDQGMDDEADLYAAAADFDPPSRVYNGVQITAEQRFSRSLMLQASYSYSRLVGNFPGLFSPETGQLDPNLTSMYDLPELMANRTGPLAADRPHQLKLDGYYILDLDRAGHFVFGTSVRGSSGMPHNYLGAHALYGFGESYLLPRGAAERSPFSTRFDVRVAYGRHLGRDTKIEVFMDVFNVFNQQPPTEMDENYTYDDVDPIVGGNTTDLQHIKVLGPSGEPVNQTATVNQNFGNASRRQAPLRMGFGARLIF